MELKDTPIETNVCMALAFFILLLRLYLPKQYKKSFGSSDYLCLLSIPFIGRWATAPISVKWGTNNVTDEFRSSHVFFSDDIYRRQVSSKLVLMARGCYASL